MRYYSDFQRLNYKRTIDAYGRWLEQHPWDTYNHLTFAYNSISPEGESRMIDKSVSPEGAKRMFEEAIKELGERIIYFRAIEWFPQRVNVHIHCLIGNCQEKINWKHGIYKIEPYDPQQGARFYLAKLCLSDRADLDYKLCL